MLKKGTNFTMLSIKLILALNEAQIHMVQCQYLHECLWECNKYFSLFCCRLMGLFLKVSSSSTARTVTINLLHVKCSTVIFYRSMTLPTQLFVMSVENYAKTKVNTFVYHIGMIRHD